MAALGNSNKDVLTAAQQAAKTKASMSTPYAQANAASAATAAANMTPEQLYFNNQAANLPYPNAPHDGGAQDLANQQYILKNQTAQNSYDYAVSNKPTWVDSLGLLAGVAPIAAIGGAVLAPAAAAAAGGATTLAGSVAGGATALGVTNAGKAALSGGNIGKAALTGAVVGGVTGGIGNLASSAGLNSSTLGKLGTSYATNAVTGNLTNAINGNASSGATGSTTSGSSGVSGTSNNGINYLGAAAGAAAAGAGASSMMNANQGNIGNIGSMASTDSSLASTITGAVPGLLQATATGAGSVVAANDRVAADNAAIGTQNTALGNINSIWSTQQGLGQGADTALGSALGTNGQPANYSGFENMPGYQFAVGQGTQAIQRQAASMGNAYTPNTAEAVGSYVTGTAMQDYNTYINQLMGAAGLGTTANQGLQTGTQNNANSVGQLQQNIGNAQASGVTGVSSAAAGLFSPNGAGTSLIGAAGNLLGKSVGGSGGSGVGSTGSANGAGGAGGVNGGGSNYSNDTGTYGTSMENQYLGTGDGTVGSGVNPSTGQSYLGSDPLAAPTFDPNSVSAPTYLDSSQLGTDSSDFGGSLDYGSDSSDLFGSGSDFLGGW